MIPILKQLHITYTYHDDFFVFVEPVFSPSSLYDASSPGLVPDVQQSCTQIRYICNDHLLIWYSIGHISTTDHYRDPS